MSETFITPETAELHDFIVTYLDGADRKTHPVRSKAVQNALASFARAVPQHGRILSVRKAKP